MTVRNTLFIFILFVVAGLFSIAIWAPAYAGSAVHYWACSRADLSKCGSIDPPPFMSVTQHECALGAINLWLKMGYDDKVVLMGYICTYEAPKPRPKPKQKGRDV